MSDIAPTVIDHQQQNPPAAGWTVQSYAGTPASQYPSGYDVKAPDQDEKAPDQDEKAPDEGPGG